MSTIIIGIDIFKKKFDVAFTINQKWQHETFENTLEGFQIFLNFLKERNIENCHGVMEATGLYGEDLANLLYISGYKVSIVNPTQIKYYGRSLLRRTKTDKIDSQLITEFAQRHELAQWEPLSPNLQSLKDQVRCLDTFKRDATQTSNRLQHAKDGMVIKMLEDRLDHIQKQIDKLVLEIRKLSHNDHAIANKIELLISIPGIAETTALALLGELPDLCR